MEKHFKKIVKGKEKTSGAVAQWQGHWVPFSGLQKKILKTKREREKNTQFGL